MSSLPVPVSPVIRTVESVGPTLAIRERTAFRGIDVPTISSNIEALSISSRRTTFSCWSFLIGFLALINLRGRTVPTLDLSLVVVQRIETTQDPAITPICSPHPQLRLVSRATGASTIGKTTCRSIQVIRMNEPTANKHISGRLPPLFKTKPNVIDRIAVCTKTFTTRTNYHNLLRCAHH